MGCEHCDYFEAAARADDVASQLENYGHERDESIRKFRDLAGAIGKAKHVTQEQLASIARAEGEL